MANYFNIPIHTNKSNSPTEKALPANVSKTIGSVQTKITILAGETLNNQFIFPEKTMIVTTFYIDNSADIPSGSKGNLQINMSNALSGQNSVIHLTAYNYGKYIENFAVNTISFANTFSVDIVLYFQYTLKTYSIYANPVIQDLTELLLIPTITTNALTGATNFRYYGSISNFIMSSFAIGSKFYVLDQQVEGLSSTSTGSVQVPYTTNYTENINVSALGAAEDSNIYSFTTDTITQLIPTNITNNNAVLNWIKVDFYSPIALSYTSTTFPITYNSTLNLFGVFANTIPIQSVAKYLTTLGSPLPIYNTN